MNSKEKTYIAIPFFVGMFSPLFIKGSVLSYSFVNDPTLTPPQIVLGFATFGIALAFAAGIFLSIKEKRGSQW